jgi:hypothetical protein
VIPSSCVYLPSHKSGLSPSTVSRATVWLAWEVECHTARTLKLPDVPPTLLQRNQTMGYREHRLLYGR